MKRFSGICIVVLSLFFSLNSDLHAGGKKHRAKVKQLKYTLTINSDREEYIEGMDASFAVNLTDRKGKAVKMKKKYLYATFPNAETIINLTNTDPKTWTYSAKVTSAGEKTLSVELRKDFRKKIEKLNSLIVKIEGDIAYYKARKIYYQNLLDNTTRWWKKYYYRAMIRICDSRINILNRFIAIIERNIAQLERVLVSADKSVTVYKAPEPVITGPVVDAFVSGIISVTVSLDWDQGGKLILVVDGEDTVVTDIPPAVSIMTMSTRAATMSLTSGTVTLDTKILTDGEHTISARVEPAGFPVSYSSSDVAMVVDNTPPEITEIIPQSDIYTNNNTPVISATLADVTSGIDSNTIKLLVDNVEQVAIIDNNTLTFTPVNPLAEGLHSFAIETADNAGNITSVTAAFSIDTTNPEISNQTPANNSSIDIPRPVISALYSDAGAGIDMASVAVTLNGTDITASSTVAATGFTYTPATDLANGVYNLALAVSDVAGNTANAAWSFTVAIDSHVTVKKGGVIQPGKTVWAFKVNGSNLVNLGSAVTDAGGIASFELVTGITVKYRVSIDGTDFYSEESTTPGDTEINVPASTCHVTVKKAGALVPDITVYAFKVIGSSLYYLGYAQTDANGIADFEIADGLVVKYRTTIDGTIFYSEESTTPGDTEINVPASTCHVTVKNAGALIPDITVYAFKVIGSSLYYLGYARTDANGVANFNIVDGITVKYRTSIDGNYIYSNEVTTPADIVFGLNHAPIVEINNDFTINFPEVANLTALVADDGIPGVSVTFLWEKVSGAGDVTFATPANATTTATFSATGSYVIQFTANDGELFTSEQVTVVVEEASPGLLGVGLYIKPVGVLECGEVNIRLTGNWENENEFIASENNTIHFDGVDQLIAGNTIFNHFLCNRPGTALTFRAGDEFDISNFELTGTPAKPLVLRSSEEGSYWYVNASLDKDVSYVDVKDSDASGGITILPLTSIDSGNNVNWWVSE